MKTSLQHNRQSRGSRGFAVIVVLALAIVMSIILVSNSRALGNLKRNLRRIEEKQLHRPGVLKTNVVSNTNAVLQSEPPKP